MLFIQLAVETGASRHSDGENDPADVIYLELLLLIDYSLWYLFLNLLVIINIF